MQLNRPALRVVGPDGDVASTKDDLDPKVAGDLREIARLTNVTSSGIARNGFFLDRIADEAAARAEGMDGSVAMLGEMVETMDQVLTSARRSSEIAERTGETSAAAGTIARDALGELDRAADTIVRLTGMVAQLRTRVEGIGGVIGAIEDISSHSHMLSINATIEAAHAGEWGRTFAVIAVEIAKFAAATKTATSEIDGILHDVRAQVEVLTGASQETLQATSHVQESSRAIERALEAVRIETDLNHQHAATMASAAAQHSAALHGVVEAIRESAAGAASSLRMAAQARELRIGDLNSGVYAILGKYRVGTFVERALAVAEAAAGEIEAVFDEALSRGTFSLDELLDPVYRELRGADVRALGRLFDVRHAVESFDPAKFGTTYDASIDARLCAIVDAHTDANPQFTALCLLDNNAFHIAHYRLMRAAITGDPAVDRAQNRIKRMFDDRTSLRCARVGLDGAEALGPRIGRRALEHAHFSLLRPPGPRPYLVQSYARDTGDVFNDLSVAIYAGGRHYGALSVAYPAQTS